VSEAQQQGLYLDAAGAWLPDRRGGKDRRDKQPDSARYHEQRKEFRRKADRELYEHDHKAMIREALDEFAAEHER
jgi:hypothetical protein